MVAAWTFTNGALKHTWTFDSAAPGWEAYSGMGNHSVTVADLMVMVVMKSVWGL